MAMLPRPLWSWLRQRLFRQSSFCPSFFCPSLPPHSLAPLFPPTNPDRNSAQMASGMRRMSSDAIPIVILFPAPKAKAIYRRRIVLPVGDSRKGAKPQRRKEGRLEWDLRSAVARGFQFEIWDLKSEIPFCVFAAWHLCVRILAC